MSIHKLQKSRLRELKLSVLKSLRKINSNRRNNREPRIMGTTTDIVNIIKLYKFYKSFVFRQRFEKSLQQKSKDKDRDKDEDTKQPTGKSEIIEKDGFQFIMLNGTFHKITKKAYTKEEMQKWCNGRKSASIKMKKYHIEKKKELKELEKIKLQKTNEIYNRELANLPEHLRDLFN